MRCDVSAHFTMTLIEKRFRIVHLNKGIQTVIPEFSENLSSIVAVLTKNVFYISSSDAAVLNFFHIVNGCCYCFCCCRCCCCFCCCWYCSQRVLWQCLVLPQLKVKETAIWLSLPPSGSSIIRYLLLKGKRPVVVVSTIWKEKLRRWVRKWSCSSHEAHSYAIGSRQLPTSCSCWWSRVGVEVYLWTDRFQMWVVMAFWWDFYCWPSLFVRIAWRIYCSWWWPKGQRFNSPHELADTFLPDVCCSAHRSRLKNNISCPLSTGS